MAKNDNHTADGKAGSPLFSIITVTYNAEATVGVTLDSVRSQTCALYEHLIIDGASSDGTLALCRQGATDRQHILSEPDRGLYDAMNKGITRASGKYLIFLNAGDAFHAPDTLQKIANTILAGNYPGVVYGQTDIVDASRRKVADRHLIAPEKLTLNSFADGMVVCHQAFVALRRIAGHFDLRYRYSADYEWCIRVLQHSRHNVLIPESIVDYLAEGMTTRNRMASLKERFRIMCHYYGTLPTVWRHLKFIPRFLRRRRQEKNF